MKVVSSGWRILLPSAVTEGLRRLSISLIATPNIGY